MAKVREVFQRALDAIIAATELSKTVASMKLDVDQLRQDIADTQARNVELDRMLSDTRRQRDEAEQNLAQAKQELTKTQEDLKFYKSTVDADAIELQKIKTDAATNALDLSTRLDAARKERDDHGLEALALREALDKANARLATIHKTMGVDFTPFDVPKAPEPTPVAEVRAWSDTPSYQSPTEIRAKVKVWSDSPDFDWTNPTKTWDEATRRYWYEQ